MSLLPNGYDPKNLSDVLGQQASSAAANQNQSYIRQKKQLTADSAASGRLNSGVSNYDFSDLSNQNDQALSGIQDNLATSLAAVPEEDWLNNQEFQRNLQLANYVGSQNKPSTLQEALSGVGSVGPLAFMAASFL